MSGTTLVLYSICLQYRPQLQGTHCQSEPEFYGDIVYKFKKISGMTDFSDQFRKIIMPYKRIGYNPNVMQQSACLDINPITIDGSAALFNYKPVDRASDSMMARPKAIHLRWFGFICCLVHWGSSDDLLLL